MNFGTYNKSPFNNLPSRTEDPYNFKILTSQNLALHKCSSQDQINSAVNRITSHRSPPPHLTRPDSQPGATPTSQANGLSYQFTFENRSSYLDFRGSVTKKPRDDVSDKKKQKERFMPNLRRLDSDMQSLDYTFPMKKFSDYEHP